MNFIFQANPPFPAQYSGANSFENRYNKATGRVITLYTGMQLGSATEILVDGEEAAGLGLCSVLGIGRSARVWREGRDLHGDLYLVSLTRGNKWQGVSIVSQMAGIFFIDGIKRSIRRRAREKKLAAARNWPTAQGEVNHWQVLNADEDVATTGTPYQIEAGFHFKLNDEYYGGYLRSVAMTHHEAETRSKGEPKVNLRYNPANPDETAVLAEDNGENLPFNVVSG